MEICGKKLKLLVALLFVAYTVPVLSYDLDCIELHNVNITEFNALLNFELDEVSPELKCALHCAFKKLKWMDEKKLITTNPFDFPESSEAAKGFSKCAADANKQGETGCEVAGSIVQCLIRDSRKATATAP